MWILRQWILLKIPAFDLCVLAPLRETPDPGQRPGPLSSPRIGPRINRPSDQGLLSANISVHQRFKSGPLMDADGPLMEGPSSQEWILRQWILLKILGLLTLTAKKNRPLSVGKAAGWVEC